MSNLATEPACTKTSLTVTSRDLPLCCPTPEMILWNAHPRVYLPIEKEPFGEITCPYCSTHFILTDDK